MKTEEEIKSRLKALKECLVNKDLCDVGSPITEQIIGKASALQWVLGGNLSDENI